MATAIQKIKDEAEKLYTIRREIEVIEKENKERLDLLKITRDQMQEKVLTLLNKHGLSSIKVSNGDSVYKGARQSIGVTNEVFALKWAMDNMAVSIDKTLVSQKLKEVDEVPRGFEVKTTEFISVRKAKNEKPE